MARFKMKLLQTHKITFTRHGDATDKTYVDEFGDTVAPETTTEIPTCGSLQPWQRKNNRAPLPEGMREEDFFCYFTTSTLRTTEQFENAIPDTCIIKGRKFKVTRAGDWNDFGLLTDNNEYVLQLVQPQGS